MFTLKWSDCANVNEETKGVSECLTYGVPQTFSLLCAQKIWYLVNKKMSSEDLDKVKKSVKHYYGKRLTTSDDLQSNASKIDEYSGMTSAVKSALKLVHEEVSSK